MTEKKRIIRVMFVKIKPVGQTKNGNLLELRNGQAWKPLRRLKNSTKKNYTHQIMLNTKLICVLQCMMHILNLGSRTNSPILY
jgi:hypothetical protein